MVRYMPVGTTTHAVSGYGQRPASFGPCIGDFITTPFRSLENTFFASHFRRNYVVYTRHKRRSCLRCVCTDDSLVDADSQLLGFGDEKQKRSCRRGRKSAPLAAAASDSSLITATNMEMIIENAAAELEKLASRKSTSAMLESAYRQPSFKPFAPHHLSPSEAAIEGAPFDSGGDEYRKKTRKKEPGKGDVCVVNKTEALPGVNSEFPLTLTSHKSGKQRLNLTNRILLKRKRLEKLAKPTSSSKHGGSEAERIGVWSDEADKIIKMYSLNLDILALDWDKLPRRRLSAQEEVTLASYIRQAKDLQKLRQEVSQHLKREPTDEEWVRAANTDMPTLRRHIQLGKSARNKMIKLNLRLVVHQAHKYYKQEMSLALFDLCQEGVLGLIRAVDKFDPERGYRFSTYAVYWIRNGILRAQTKLGHALRAPYNVAVHRMNIKKTQLDLAMELERDPTHQEIRNRVGLTEKRYGNILKTTIRRSSLNEISRITGEEIIQNVADPDDAETQYLKSNAGAILRFGMDDVLDSLKPKESLVIRQRYGLDGKGERSFTEIGRNLNLSREMVRRYEIRGMLKLRHPARVKYLRGFLM